MVSFLSKGLEIGSGLAFNKLTVASLYIDFSSVHSSSKVGRALGSGHQQRLIIWYLLIKNPECMIFTILSTPLERIGRCKPFTLARKNRLDWERIVEKYWYRTVAA